MTVKARPNIQHLWVRVREAKADVCDGVFDIYNVYKHTSRKASCSWSKYVKTPQQQCCKLRQFPWDFWFIIVIIVLIVLFIFAVIFCVSCSFFVLIFFVFVDHLPCTLACVCVCACEWMFSVYVTLFIHISAPSMLKGISCYRYSVPMSSLRACLLNKVRVIYACKT